MAILLIIAVAENGQDFTAEVIEPDDFLTEEGKIVPMRSMPDNQGWPEVGESFEAHFDGKPN